MPGDELAFAGEQRLVFLSSAGGGDLAGFLAEGFVGELSGARGLDFAGGFAGAVNRPRFSDGRVLPAAAAAGG